MKKPRPQPCKAANEVYGWPRRDYIPAILCLVFKAFLCALLPAAVISAAPPTHAATVTLVGDSTVASYNPAWTELTGWGQVLGEYTLPGVAINNRAIGGKSSRSYLPHWPAAMSTPAEFVFIQFGSNDVPGAGPENETSPDAVPDPLPADPTAWFRHNIATYITDAQAAGSVPVVVMPMERALYRNGTVQRHTEPYALAAQQVAAEHGVAVVDLNAFSVDLYNALGQPAFEYYHTIDGKLDQTHFNPAGASLYAGEVARQLQHTGLFAIPGDTDADGDVDDSDLGVVFANYTGPVGAFGYKTLADGDLDGDGDVDDSDVGGVLAVYTGAVSSVPEPSGLLALLVLARCRRK